VLSLSFCVIMPILVRRSTGARQPLRSKVVTQVGPARRRLAVDGTMAGSSLALPSTASVSIADADYRRLLQLASGRLDG